MPAFYLTLSLALYLLCLAFDGALMGADRHMPALQMLLYGPWGVPFGLFQWFANPLLALAFLSHRRFRRLALGLGLGALYLAASSFGIERLPDNISYEFHERTGFGAGFYLWLAAIVVFCAGQAWQCWKARSRDDVPGWNWLDVALIAALGVTFYAATQMPSLRFEPGKVLMPPEQPRAF
ncbi:hypothetical protein C4Q28_05740 [Pseudomonas sp. SWI6]|uniref:Uncharacterized protein n=1 Tax=Pseudomonas taiwanensis TaxID=470150 RepID=A0ABR6V486_9PSED|nr:MULTISPECIES: hypothetical protein [Pseudomonas]AGZ36963.1 hypothetical protein PVLB_20910 [Pseudomonas sp. VLB120]AVD81696.1 hypothetical protein C4Q28_05740 [Pseudomonas sp. SWI6]MBC3475320.1 hypothetical protein [Pseudomonas taiwanensis]MBC3491190.1 hypothetical protein [Pseudomonas taiwanensis]MDT8922618.1 hypothetical protein [Pseudomonas taiwanensis]